MLGSSLRPPLGTESSPVKNLRIWNNTIYDWQGGLVWLRMEAEPEADLVRRLVRAHGGGHATLVRASPAQRSSARVFEPQPAALAALSARLKAQFDPMNILNPGRMTPDAD